MSLSVARETILQGTVIMESAVVHNNEQAVKAAKDKEKRGKGKGKGKEGGKDTF